MIEIQGIIEKGNAPFTDETRLLSLTFSEITFIFTTLKNF